MWRKAKKALGLNLCVFDPSTTENNGEGDEQLELSRSSSGSSKKCVICFGSMRAGHGALFTAECSHTFHFSCIASNVKHGNFICPICRASWKQIPFQRQLSIEQPYGRSRVNPVNLTQENPQMTVVRRFNRNSSNRQNHQLSSQFASSEPSTFNDDESLDFPSDTSSDAQQILPNAVDIKTYAEFSAVGELESVDNFGVLIHLRAPHASIQEMHLHTASSNGVVSGTSRAPIDLVTVLDVSGSMAGTKLALLKRAMGFVIQNLGPSDRLSVVSFSSAARRLFPLRRMSDLGRQHALQAVNSLVSSGGTNIAEGLRKGAKVIEERKEKNPVCSIILLSDGQDTYTLPSGQHSMENYRSLIPSSIIEATTYQIPVHAFGFGLDHDSAAMHAISHISGGTFSFIEAETVIQDAFAQCIGGLLSVVVQDMQVSVECVHPGVQLAPINSGSYASDVTDNRRSGTIEVGDLYADEERNFLVSVSVPPAEQEILLLNVSCRYRDPISNDIVTLDDKKVCVRRPRVVLSRSVSIEVDRERNRIQAAEAMAEARAAAERCSFSEAVAILSRSRLQLSESLAGHTGDQLCASLDAELKEMQERMASRHRYEVSGRAFLLSGLSSHSSQRATTRGNSIHSGSLFSSYQTQSMVDMLQRSQTMLPTAPVRPSRHE